MNNENKIPKTKKSKKKTPIASIIARIILALVFVFLILVNGVHYSSLFLVVAVFFTLPLPFVTSFLKKNNIKKFLVITLVALLFFSWTVSTPLSESQDNKVDVSTDTSSTNISSDNASEESDTNTTNTDSETNDTSTENSTDSTNSDTETQDSESNTTDGDITEENESTLVWVTESGSKYHSSSSCSGMRSPKQILLSDAESDGYSPCKKCYK